VKGMAEIDVLLSLALCEGNFKKHCNRLLKRTFGRAHSIVLICLADRKKLVEQIDFYQNYCRLEALGGQGVAFVGRDIIPINLYADTVEDRNWALANEKQLSRFIAEELSIREQVTFVEVLLFINAHFSGQISQWDIRPRKHNQLLGGT